MVTQDKFKPNQMVRIKTLDEIHPQFRGKLVTIVQSRQWKFLRDFDTSKKEKLFAYKLDLMVNNEAAWAEEHQLASVYDGDLPGSWENCAWIPMELRLKQLRKEEESKHEKVL